MTDITKTRLERIFPAVNFLEFGTWFWPCGTHHGVHFAITMDLLGSADKSPGEGVFKI